MSKFWASNPDESSSSNDDDESSSSSWSTSSNGDHSNIVQSSLDAFKDDTILESTDTDDFEGIGLSCDFQEKSSFLDNAAADDEYDNLHRVWERIKPEQVFMEPIRESYHLESTRIVCISDTHSQHRECPFLPPGDVLIHAGDFTKSGEPGTVLDLAQYFDSHQNKNFSQGVICIAGNHDITFHEEYYCRSDSRRVGKQKAKREEISNQETSSKEVLRKHCNYLEDSTYFLNTTSDSRIEVFGSPWTPSFYNWAFNLDRGPPIQTMWSKIPTSTDILITHGPPLGRRDKGSSGHHVGCFDLLQQVQERIVPRLHIFGHVHSGYGTSYDGHTLYVNASMLDESDEAIHKCIVIDVPHDQNQPAQIVDPECTVNDFAPWILQQQGEVETYSRLKEHCTKYSTIAAMRPEVKLPEGNELLQESAYHDICNGLHIHRDPAALQELRIALSQIYAESFNRAS
mmetsp:Transcript_15330/g.22618  ORF Transcript_15330/g.22618 Transcript_15330/m.22618 type:complete len:457 (+) Transcript_15330:124-1494(+)|eukprot:CAMPEP_0194204586 /NCGR_PEP_ID=MMETSP0156-20130528/4064_1 /TAXON_ID=33649 /ORGANISM="Thalassionema nitzschioides, Strain L26-B" /LENGTH=456 /DNA_ID=CAMNT_0038930635 /DNA_START=120 /DNA_END=1490 /DNA_ORIENTATION=-